MEKPRPPARLDCTKSHTTSGWKWKFWKQDHIRPGGHSRFQGQPAGFRPINSHTMTRWWLSAVVCRRSSDSRGGAGGGGEAKGEIGSNEVVVDGFRNPNHGQSSLGNRSRAAHGAIAANHHQSINPMFSAVARQRSVASTMRAFRWHRCRRDSAQGSSPVVRAENRATLVKDAGDRISVQGHHPIFHQALVAIQDAHGFNPMS